MSCSGGAEAAARLSAAVSALKARGDRDWYGDILQKSTAGRGLSQEERTAVIEGSMDAAREAEEMLRVRFGRLTPEGYAAALGLEIRYIDDVIAEFLYMGLYDPSERVISVNEGSIGIAQRFVLQNELNELTPAAEIRDAALLHEIFHALEDRIQGIYTRQRMLKRRLFGLFPRWEGLDAAGEIGAVHFSKRMGGFLFSPCIYEYYLLLSEGKISLDTLLHKQ